MKTKTLLLSILFILLCSIIIPESSYGKWLLQKKIDPIDDTVSVIAVGVETRDKMLMVTCVKRPHLAVGITWGSFSPFGISGRNNRSKTILYRFDKEKPGKMEWNLGGNGKTTFFTDPLSYRIEKFLEKLRKHKKLVVRARGYQGKRITIAFSLIGSAYPIEMVEYACGVRKEKPKKREKAKREIF